MANTVKFSVSLPEDLAQRMDIARGPLGRSPWIQTLIDAHFKEWDGRTERAARGTPARMGAMSSLDARAHVKPIPKRETK